MEFAPHLHPEATPFIPVNKEIPIPFAPGFEIKLCAADANDIEGNQLQEVHIWRVGESDDWDTLTGAGFIKTVNFVEETLKENKIKKFVISASDEKRRRVFTKWAIKKGCTEETVKDYFGDEIQVFTLPTSN